MTFSDAPEKHTCPYCGREKYLVAIASGNTIGGMIWSDSKSIYPMLPQTSPIQKCPHCSRYYFLDSVKRDLARVVTVDGKEIELKWLSIWDRIEKKDEGREKTPEELEMEKIRERVDKEASKNRFGELNYQDLAEAFKDLMLDDVSEEHRVTYQFAYVFAYNDARTGRAHSDKEDIPESYNALFRECAMGLIEHFGEEMTITAELWRELGNFDKSIELCQKLIAVGTDVGVVKQILERAQNSDPSVFVLKFDEED